MKLEVETIQPTSMEHWLRLRAKDITSTEVSALFDCSPYLTLFQMWHRKKNLEYVQLEESERMKWGTRLQEAIAGGLAEEHGWKIRRMAEYMRIANLKIGASFDFAINDDGILEIKNVDGLVFRNEWIEEGDRIEAPPHIELQLQQQLLVSGRKYGYIGALVGGNRCVLIRRDADPKVADRIKEVCALFWQSVRDNIPPKPNFERDASFISLLYRYADPNKCIEPTERIKELALEYSEASKRESAARKEKSKLKAQALVEIGDAERVQGNGLTIAAGMIGPTVIKEYERKGYRNFKVYLKKHKENKNAKAN